MKKVVIIGGGASGLISSIFAKNKDNEVIILERNSVCGKKILATGNGRCNYWNEDQNLRHYNSTSKNLLEKIITLDNQKQIMTLFNRIGIVPKIKNGYYYPTSNQAISIRNALVTEATKLGVKIYQDALVDKVTHSNNKYIVEFNNKKIIADSLIIATGSKASPKTGSTGIGYTLAKSLGHTIIEPLPALVQLVGQGKYFTSWDGIRSDVNVSLYAANKFIKEETGEIQLTSYGVSGICIFNLSRFASAYLKENKKVEVVINFLPWLKEDAITYFDKRTSLMPSRTIFELLEGLLNNKLLNTFLSILKIDESRKWTNMSKQEKINLINVLTNFHLPIIDTKSFDNAQVCSGGVDLSEINPNTMESLINKNLYIVGELLDVDGDCGGYNLSFAWISGMLAGKSIGVIK